MGHIDFEDLKISPELKSKLILWDKKYQDTLAHNYPPDSREFTEQASFEFNEEGFRLAKELAREIGDKYKIEYYWLSYDKTIKIIQIN